MAAARLDEEEVHVADKRQAAGFYDAAAYQQARRSEAEIDALRGALEQFDAQHSAATARVSRAAAAAARLTPPDLPALTAAVLTARDQLETAQQTQATLQSELTQLQRLRTAAQAEVIEQEELAAQYAVVQEVAQVASGDNPLRITFHRYVLAALLGQVLIDASHRLQVMSAARTSRTRALSRYRLSSSRSCAPTWRR